MTTCPECGGTCAKVQALDPDSKEVYCEECGCIFMEQEKARK